MALDQYKVLDALTQADFNLNLAAENLNTTAADLLTHLTPENEAALANHMRIRVILETYQLWQGTRRFFIEALGDAEPKDIIKAFGALTESVGRVSSDRASAVNRPGNAQMAQVVLNLLPPDQRDTVLNLIKDPAFAKGATIQGEVLEPNV